MARSGQASHRRKRALDEHLESPVISFPLPSTTSKNDTEVKDNPRAQCLPVGELPDDFDGVPLDGSQFLAMAAMVNDKLPPFKTVPNPYRAYSPSPPTNPHASSSKTVERHPALPKTSWEVLFSLHFVAYRKHVASRWPPSPLLPYPADYPELPAASYRSQWFMFIKGYSSNAIHSEQEGRKALARARTKVGKKEKQVIVDEEEEMNGVVLPVAEKQEEEEVDMDIDDEDDGEGIAHNKVEPTKRKLKRDARESRGPPGPPREPLVGVLQRLTSEQALDILGHFATWLDETINQLPSPIPSDEFDFIPTQPVDPTSDDDEGNDANLPSASVHKTKETTAIIPLTANYQSWIFSLLLIVDNQLASEQMSILRELARSAMRVAGWRWIRAVVAGEVNQGWALGGTDRTNSKEGNGDDDLDETLARCWIIVHAVAAGWAQKDLLEDLENIFT